MGIVAGMLAAPQDVVTQERGLAALASLVERGGVTALRAMAEGDGLLNKVLDAMTTHPESREVQLWASALVDLVDTSAADWELAAHAAEVGAAAEADEDEDNEGAESEAGTTSTA